MRHPEILFTFSISQFLLENQKLLPGVLSLGLTSLCFSSLWVVELSLSDFWKIFAFYLALGMFLPYLVVVRVFCFVCFCFVQKFPITPTRSKIVSLWTKEYRKHWNIILLKQNVISLSYLILMDSRLMERRSPSYSSYNGSPNLSVTIQSESSRYFYYQTKITFLGIMESFIGRTFFPLLQQ